MDNLISTMDIISFIASVASLMLAIVAIYVSFEQKKEADRINSETKSILIDIKSDAKSISQVAMPELKEYGKSMRDVLIGKARVPVFDAGKENVDKVLNALTLELQNLQGEKDINKLQEKIHELEKSIENSAEEKTAQYMGLEEVLLNLTELGRGYNALLFNKNYKFKNFQDMIYTEILRGKVSQDSYGNEWCLVDSETDKPIKGGGGFNEKTLSEIGVSVDKVYKVVLLS